jgi:hypothetical protein
MFYFWLWEHLCKSDKTTRSLHYLQIMKDIKTLDLGLYTN